MKIKVEPTADQVKGKTIDDLEIEHIKRIDSDTVDSDAFTERELSYDK